MLKLQFKVESTDLWLVLIFQFSGTYFNISVALNGITNISEILNWLEQVENWKIVRPAQKWQDNTPEVIMTTPSKPLDKFKYSTLFDLLLVEEEFIILNECKQFYDFGVWVIHIQVWKLNRARYFFKHTVNSQYAKYKHNSILTIDRLFI